MRKPLRHFSWELRSCGRHGHVTYRPTETQLADRLRVDTARGEAWRCLRCADFVVGPPHASGPADDAPLVLRGEALRDAFILRLLAAERGIRAFLMFALAYGVWRFNGARDSLQRVFAEYLPLLRPLANRLGVDLETIGPVRLIEKALHTGHHALTLVAIGLVAYGVLETVEAVGLWLMRRWGEYVAVVGTGVFIPLEVYELLERVTWLRIGAMIVNVFAVVYIIWTKRLFGVRGGKEAFEAERHGASLLEVESAALEERPWDQQRA